MGAEARLHALAGPPGSGLERALGLGDTHRYRAHTPLIGPFPSHIATVTAPAELLAEVGTGLPEGAARAEAIAVRLRRRGVSLTWGEPERLSDVHAVLARCMELGHSSLQMVRADPSLLPEMQVGNWFGGTPTGRLVRRAVLPRARPRGLVGSLLAREVRLIRAQIDAAFWAGACSRASEDEWRRLTGSGYVALVYHRMAGEDRPGEEKLDISPARVSAQMRLLTALRFTVLAPECQLRFHADHGELLPPRSVVVTVDDGFRDCLEPLRRHRGRRPQMFVPTREAGGPAHWMAGEQVMTWDELEQLREAGVAVGSHARNHRPLTGLPGDDLAGELGGSLDDLRRRLTDALPVISYPNGRHDLGVCHAAAEAGYVAAYTTEKGVNGAGTDPHCLKRVSVYGYDGLLAFAWKALTGEAVPAPIERRRTTRLRRGRRRRRGAEGAAATSDALVAPDTPDALVSLVMAAFRPRREWLLEAVSSALAQRGCRVELIVVDDGSPDRVAEMLEQIEDPRLRLLRVPHGGRSPALNAGVAAARGDFIRFIDADDYLEPGGTAHLLRLLGGDRDVISYGATLECDEQLRPMRAMTCDLDGSVATACLLDAFDVRVFSMLFPREVAEGIGGWDPVLPACRDWDYSLRAFERARVRGDRTIVTHYRRHPGGVSADLEACLRGERLVIERYFDRHPEHRGTSLERRCRARLHRTEARTYQANPSTRRAFRRSMAFALCLAPVDTLRDLGDDARSLARGFIGSLRRAALAAGPR